MNKYQKKITKLVKVYSKSLDQNRLVIIKAGKQSELKKSFQSKRITVKKGLKHLYRKPTIKAIESEIMFWEVRCYE
nr:MAG TPA: hypothetical protein [Caudoviricetes sp.]